MSRVLFAVILLVFTLSSYATAANDEVAMSGPRGLKAYVKKKGAEIRLHREQNGTRSGEVKMLVDSIHELKADFSEQEKAENFNNIDFVCNERKNVTLDRTNGVKADCLDCTGAVQKPFLGAQMGMTVCVINTDGRLTLGNGSTAETSELRSGTLKFMLELSSWPFATASRYLDIQVNVKIPPGQMKREDPESGRPCKFQLGNEATANFSSKVLLDGKWYDMVDDYPQYEQRGANNYIVLRVPRFNSSLLYDPDVTVGDSPVGDSATSFTVHSLLLLAALLLARFLAS